MSFTLRDSLKCDPWWRLIDQLPHLTWSTRKRLCSWGRGNRRRYSEKTGFYMKKWLIWDPVRQYKILNSLDNYHPERIIKAPTHGTLNLKVRMQELSRIDRENEKIKDKLISQKTHYPVTRFIRDANEKETIKKNILFNASNKNFKNNCI